MSVSCLTQVLQSIEHSGTGASAVINEHMNASKCLLKNEKKASKILFVHKM